MAGVQKMPEFVADAEALPLPARSLMHDDGAFSTLRRCNKRRLDPDQRRNADVVDIQRPGDRLNRDRPLIIAELAVDGRGKLRRVRPPILDLHPVEGKAGGSGFVVTWIRHRPAA